MIGLLLLVASVLALVFGAIWSFRAWGVGACVGLAVPGGLVILFVPYGQIVVLIVALVVLSAAQKRLFQRIADGEVDPDPPAWGQSPGYPYAAPAAAARPAQCHVCRQPSLQWVAEQNRWYCGTCQDYR